MRPAAWQTKGSDQDEKAVGKNPARKEKKD